MNSKYSSVPRKRSRSDATWTRNPRDSGRNATKNSPFAHIGSYMEIKNRKLREQFDAGASASSLDSSGIGGGKGIFCGVSIFVDGFTVPSSQELRACMMKHGGRYENYFSRRSVTHIICSHLPDGKMRNFRAFSRGLPVVKPAWVVESVVANKLLSWVPYQLNELENGIYKQQTLSSFFARKRISCLTNDEKNLVSSLPTSASGSVLHKDEKMKHLMLDGEGECSKVREESVYIGNDKFYKVEYANSNIENTKEELNMMQLESGGASINDTTLKELSDNFFFEPFNQQPNPIEDYTKGGKENRFHQIQLPIISCSRPADYNSNMMPQSLSQLDFSVLHELPEELKVGILKSLPPHRESSFLGNGPSSSGKFPCDMKDENSGYLTTSLWTGTPPSWVQKFQHSNCFLLNIIAAQYTRSDTNGLLSLTFQSLRPFLSAFSDLSALESDEMLSSLFELFKQYIELKVESDIEELYVCFRILQRFATDFQFLKQVYDLILPFLQATISENYGGNFRLSISKE
ncbi:DNA repair protein REV1-like [Canna indica]|uniref:DNA repair protein REV1-like n=1 Tax=Canna indica TaxID=4628 RepID=A0AAQ3JT86_9LILI|nr:DNA repair protein REV1-like [Canna indica]